eukprot:15334399-Ditylum_brightwellii.AAC.1
MIIPEEDLPTNVVKLADANRNSAVLHQVSSSKGIKMLGIYKAFTLDETEELDYLLNKAATYISASCTCPLQAHELWLGYITVEKAPQNSNTAHPPKIRIPEELPESSSLWNKVLRWN